MKRTVVAVMVLIATVVAGANAGEPGELGFRMFADLRSYRELNFTRVAKSYIGSLEYRGCHEIVECGLAHVAMLSLAQPGAASTSLTTKVDELALKGETPAIRYKAYLTSMVFERPELFIFEKYGEYKNGDELFTALAQRLQKEALAVK